MTFHLAARPTDGLDADQITEVRGQYIGTGSATLTCTLQPNIMAFGEYVERGSEVIVLRDGVCACCVEFQRKRVWILPMGALVTMTWLSLYFTTLLRVPFSTTVLERPLFWRKARTLHRTRRVPPVD